MDGLVCRLEKILHEGQRLLPEIPLKGNELTELEHPYPEPVNTALAFQEAQREQFAGQAVDRRLRDSRAASHFRKGQLSVGRGVGAEDPEGSLKHRPSSRISHGGMHVVMLASRRSKVQTARSQRGITSPAKWPPSSLTSGYSHQMPTVRRLAADDIVEAMMRVEVAWMRALAQGGAATAGRDADPASYLGPAGTLVDEVLAPRAARKASDG